MTFNQLPSLSASLLSELIRGPLHREPAIPRRVIAAPLRLPEMCLGSAARFSTQSHSQSARRLCAPAILTFSHSCAPVLHLPPSCHPVVVTGLPCKLHGRGRSSNGRSVLSLVGADSCSVTSHRVCQFS